MIILDCCTTPCLLRALGTLHSICFMFSGDFRLPSLFSGDFRMPCLFSGDIRLPCLFTCDFRLPCVFTCKFYVISEYHTCVPVISERHTCLPVISECHTCVPMISECHICLPIILWFQNAIEGRMQSAQDWLQDPAALVGSAGKDLIDPLVDWLTNLKMQMTVYFKTLDLLCLRQNFNTMQFACLG